MKNFFKSISKVAFDVLAEEAAKESADYIRPYIKEAIITDTGWWNISIEKIEIDGLHLEFGVYKGESINYFSSKKSNTIWYGFDSFEGFQEDWQGGFYGKSTYSLKGQKPVVNKNVKLIKGYFKDTLPKFLKNKKQNIAFLHIDCDTYESTKQVLNIISSKRLVANTRILFDEYTSYIGWKENEFKAWKEFVQENNINYKYEMFGDRQALIKII
jgi:hypothetical protein